jgi:hypothetical protein
MPTVSGIIVPTSAEASGRRTLADVVAELSRSIDADDTTVQALAGDAFRSAVRVMNRKGLWPWEIMQEDLNLIQNNAFSTAISPIKKPLAMHFLSTSGGTPDQPIGYLPYDHFIEKYSLNIAGEPHTYTIPNLFETGQIRWFPIPNGNDNARFDYYRVTPAPRSDDEAIEIPDYAMEVYVSRAWYEFVKRLSSRNRPMPIEVAIAESKAAFRELSAHVNSLGDRGWWTGP